MAKKRAAGEGNIRKRKDGRWEGRYKKGVASNSRTIYGSCYGKTYSEVKEKLEDCKRKMPQSLGCKKLFGTYCDEWLVVNQNNVKLFFSFILLPDSFLSV